MTRATLSIVKKRKRKKIFIVHFDIYLKNFWEKKKPEKNPDIHIQTGTAMKGFKDWSLELTMKMWLHIFKHFLCSRVKIRQYLDVGRT